jgi:hypothetical protein
MPLRVALSQWFAVGTFMKTFAHWISPRRIILVAALLCAQLAGAAETERTVVELFTSQGCSSCPPADAVAGRLRANPAVIVLSFHVNYWDGPQWRDPFASQASTDRQYAYARALRERSVFTPQLVVNGMQSLVGSEEVAIQRAIAAAGRVALPVQVDLARQPGGGFVLTLKGSAISAELWEVDYVQHTATQIRGGENDGRKLETYNDVTRIRRLGAFSPGTVSLPALIPPANGLAVVVQTPNLGQILGAVAYEIR